MQCGVGKYTGMIIAGKEDSECIRHGYGTFEVAFTLQGESFIVVKYEGEYQFDKMEGTGKLLNTEGEYKGGFQEDKKHGHGVMLYINKDYFEVLKFYFYKYIQM